MVDPLLPDPPLKIVGAPGSPYSRKLRAVLRYRRIPHRWVVRGSHADLDTPPTPVSLLPVLVFPGRDGAEDEAGIDSTPLIRRLETMYSGRAVLPRDPALAFVSSLLEDYGDEWLTKAMFHYRWVYEADIDKAARILPLWRGTNRPDAEIAKLSKMFAERQIDRLWVVGSNETTGPVIEASYERLLRLLDAHLAEHLFVLGGRPSSADFALYGQLTPLTGFDPTSAAVALDLAPRVVAWVDLVEDLSGFEYEGAAEGWFSRDSLPATLGALLCEVGRVYAPFLLANADALERGAERVECVIDDAKWVQKPFPYQGKCLRALREEYAALAPDDRKAVDAILAGTGCEPLFSDF
jgi:glutathione S-transferase